MIPLGGIRPNLKKCHYIFGDGYRSESSEMALPNVLANQKTLYHTKL